VIRICIADDHEILRQSMEQILLKTPDIRVVDQAGTGEMAIAKALENDYDLLLLGVSMSDWNGIEVLKTLKNMKPGLKVLILSMHGGDLYAVRALKAGASGYLTKDSTIDELVLAIRRIAQGKKYVSSSLAERLAFALGPDTDIPAHERLSDREYQVMVMIATGKNIKAIGHELSLSPKTITTHKKRILEKLNLNNIAELIRYILEHGLMQ